MKFTTAVVINGCQWTGAERLASTLIVVRMFLEKLYYAKNYVVTINLANTGVQSTQKLKKIQLKSIYVH